jgi:hypothetical protein
MIDKLTAVPFHFAVTLLPWIPGRHHGGRINHPLASLILLVLVFALVYWAFRRRAS